MPTMTTRILITGSRNWSDVEAIEQALDLFRTPLVIVHGDSPTGADAIAKAWAERTEGVEQEAHPADWSRGRKAGPLRNQEMIDLGGYWACIAFPLGDSRGTRDCMRRAEAAGIPLVNRGDGWVLR